MSLYFNPTPFKLKEKDSCCRNPEAQLSVHKRRLGNVCLHIMFQPCSSTFRLNCFQLKPLFKVNNAKLGGQCELSLLRLRDKTNNNQLRTRNIITSKTHYLFLKKKNHLLSKKRVKLNLNLKNFFFILQ